MEISYTTSIIKIRRPQEIEKKGSLPVVWQLDHLSEINEVWVRLQK